MSAPPVEAPAVENAGPRRRPTRGWVAVALVGLAFAAGSAFSLAPLGSGMDASGDGAALSAYLEAVTPLAQDGGRIVQNGMKPGLADVAAGTADQEWLGESAAGWAREMRAVRGAWAGVEPPEALAAAHEQFLQALDRYVAVAIVLEEAARVEPDARGPFIDLAQAEGTAADALWDEAVTAAHDELRRAGVPPAGWLAD